MQQKKIHRNFPGIIYVLANIKGGFLLIDIQDKLENSWTHEQIAGRAKLDKLYNISFKTIYRAIEDGFVSENAVKLLPRKGKVKKNGVIEKRGSIPDKKMIEERPQEANNNLKFLPPEAEIETITILKQLNKSSRALAELKAYSEMIPNKDILISSLALQEAKASSEIENIVTTNDNLYKSIVTEKTIDPNTKEVLNYRKALWKGVDLVKASGFISTNIILEIQQMLEDNKGGIRKISGTALRNSLTGDVIYTPPAGESLIRDLLANLEEYYNIETEVDPLIKLAVSHYQFEAIHPFYDGNGRTGRILNILYLLKEELLDSPILYLSSYIIKNKQSYYSLLNKITTENNWEEWILYILKAIEFTAKETLELAKEIKALIDNTIAEVREKLPKIYSKELIEFIFTEIYTKGSHLVKKGFANRKTVSKYLKSLEEIDILKSEKMGREVIYINIHLFNLLKNK